MKNLTKRLLSVALALVLTMSLVLPVAAGTTDGTELPKAKVTNLLTGKLTEDQQAVIDKAAESKIELSFALQFAAYKEADEEPDKDNAWPKDEWLADFGDWPADFVMTVYNTGVEGVKFDTDEDENPNGYLAGEYGTYGWIPVPSFGLAPVTLKDKESVRILAYAAEKLNQPGLANVTYEQVCKDVQIFNCGVYFEPEYLEAHPDFYVTLALRLYDPNYDPESKEEQVVHDICEFEFSASDLYVATIEGKGGFVSLSRAIAAADDGDTIYVKPGTIDERIAPWASDTTHVSEKSITLLGGNHENNPMSAWDESKETVLTGGIYLGRDDGHCSDTTITIKGFTFTENGLVISGQENVHIENNRFVSITSIPTTNKTATNNAISVTGQTYQNMNGTAVIRNNVIGDTASGGINLRNSKDVTIEGNYISHTDDNSITIQHNDAGGTVRIADNILMNWGTGGEGRAIRVSTTAAVTITGNSMTNENAPEEFVKVTGTNSVTAFSNGWNGENPTGKTGADKAYFLTDLETPIVKLLRDYYVAGTLYDICQPHNWSTTAEESEFDSENDCVSIYNKVCIACGKTAEPNAENQIFVPKAEPSHAWSTDFQPGDDTHWNYCTNDGCTAKKDEAAHTWGKNHMDEAHIVVDANNNACAVAYHITCDICAKSHATDIFWVKQENPVHVYDNGVVTKEATCTAIGIMTYTCTNDSCGHTKTETIEKKAHTEVDIPAVAPTCTASGLTAGKKCSVCGVVTMEPETISVKPHTEVEIPAKAATCTEPGLTAGKKCSVCGEILVAQTETSATGHDWGYRAGVTPEGHKHWMWCRNFCGADIKEMGDHVYTHSDDLSKYNVMEKTECGTIVYVLPECEVCGFDGPLTAAQKKVYKEDGEHVFDEGEVIKKSTCSEAGEIVYTCTVELCGFEKTEKLPLAAHSLKKVEGKEATYSAAGVKEHYACSACDALFADAEGKTAITDVVIPQLIKVEGTTAKVETGAVDSALTEAVEKAEESGTKAEVIIEVEKAVDTEASTDPSAPADTVKPEDVEKVVEVQLPVASIDKVVEAKAELTVVMPNVTVTMDTEALKTVSDQAAGEAVTLVVEEVKTETLTVAQQKTVEKYDVAVTITAELICQTTGEKIWTEKANEAVESGSITVKLPFTPAENTEGSDYAVLYIDDDGSVTEIETDFVDGHLVFALEHFSDYVVVNTAAKAYPDSPATGDNANIVLLAIMAILSVAGVAVCVLLMRKNRYIPKH